MWKKKILQRELFATTGAMLWISWNFLAQELVYSIKQSLTFTVHDKLCYRLRILNQILVSNDFLLYDVFGTYLQCFSTRLLSAIFSPISVQTGLVSPTLAKSAFTAITRPPVDKEPIFTINTSFFDNFWTCIFKINFRYMYIVLLYLFIQWLMRHVYNLFELLHKPNKYFLTSSPWTKHNTSYNFTLAPFLSPSVLTPRSLLSKKKEMVISV